MNMIYRMLKSVLLFYNKFTTNLKECVFETNPYDRCTANKIVNGKSLTAVWHADDFKASHE